MDARDATEKHQQAAELYREGRFEDAYAIVASLEQEFPDDTDLMFERALCLAAMQRRYEAQLLFKKLQATVGDGPWTPHLAAHHGVDEESFEAEKKLNRPRSISASVLWVASACLIITFASGIVYLVHPSGLRTTPTVSSEPRNEEPLGTVVTADLPETKADVEPSASDDSPEPTEPASSTSDAQATLARVEKLNNAQLLAVLVDSSLFNQALVLLGQRISADDTKELCKRLRKDSKITRRAFSARLLGYKRLLGGTGALIEALEKDDSRYVRREAAQALGLLEQKRGAEALEQALFRDPHTTVRKQAAWALRQVLGREALPKLETALQCESNAGVRLTIQWMMDVDFKSTRPPDLTPGEPVRGSYRGMLYMVYVPTGTPPEGKWPLLVSIHALDAVPDASLEICRQDAEKYGVAVLAPYFDYPEFPTYETLNIGLGMHRSDLAVLEIVDALREKVPIDAERLYLYGHSTGGQLVLRFVAAHPDRVLRAAVGSSPNYVMPDPTVLFPHGMKLNPEAPDLTSLDFSKVARTPLIVLLGEKEGASWHELAKRFVQAARTSASEQLFECQVKYLSVPKGVFSSTSNYPFASRFLFQNLRARQDASATASAEEQHK